MPEFWMPALVRVEARTRAEAIGALTAVWADDEHEVPVVDGIDVLVMADDDAMTEGDMLADEETHAEYAARWGFSPPLPALRAMHGSVDRDPDPDTTCGGTGEIVKNPSYPDPQTEESWPCPGCPECTTPADDLAVRC